jgi:polyketide synthase PksN
LITKYQATIILSGRKKEDRIAVEKESADVFMDRLRYLKSLSASLIYFSIDVANREDLENMVCHVEKQISRIDGVIHTAGFTDSSGFEFINELTIDRTRQIFSPKVQGIENMYTIFRDRKPDFVWVTSSLAAVLGGLGFAAYSSSNLYMDHFLTSRSAELPNWKCINLSEMLFDEKTILKERSERRTALKPAELALLFEWSVSIKGHPVILETVTDLNARLQRAYKPEHLLEMAPATEKIKLKRPGASVDYIQPTNNTEKVLAGIMEDFFSLEKIGITDDFFDLGGDSLKAMVLIQRINKEFDMNLALKDFFTNRNIKNMAAEIDNITFLLEKKERQSKLIV